MSHSEIAKLAAETSMPSAAPRSTLQERVSAAILEAAAEVLASRGEVASMADVAAAAGVGRATVYRYFPSREALLDELADLALRTAGDRLLAAGLPKVSVEEGLARAVRVLVGVGDYFVVLARERVRPDPTQLEQRLSAPLRALLERGQETGVIRTDVPVSWLTDSLLSLVVSVLLARPALGEEDAVAVITGLFLDGCRERPKPMAEESVS
jgi:TetR/AcrR family transcriptional regulator, mexCD-oprJ operon repressor